MLWESPIPRKQNTLQLMSSIAKLLVLTGFILLTSVGNTYAAGVEIIAHRGASHDAPENTMASIRLAWKRNADAVEIDVMLSRDGRIVLFHDKTLKRLAGREGKVSHLTLAELRRLDVGKWKDEKWSGERIPLLTEALATIPKGKRMFVELKTGPEIVPELKRVVAAAGKAVEQIVFISFNHDTCARIKRELPEHVVAYISRYRNPPDPKKPTPTIDELISHARAAKLDALDLDGNGGVGVAEARKMKEAGLGFYVWTINDPKRAHELIAAGVEGITTDRPGWLRDRLE